MASEGRRNGVSPATRLMSKSTSSEVGRFTCANNPSTTAGVLTVDRPGTGTPAPREKRRAYQSARDARTARRRGGELVGLLAGVRWKRVVFERVVFREHIEPCGLLEVRDWREQAHHPREARERRDAQHRRQQQQAVRPRQVVVLERCERIVHDQRAAIRVADEQERLRRANARAEVTDAQAYCSGPVFPVGGDETGGNRAVSRHAEPERVVAAAFKRAR